MSKLADLQKRRRQLVEKVAQTFREIESVDNQITTLIERARSVLIGDEQQDLQALSKVRPWHATTGDFMIATGTVRTKKGREPSLQRPIVEALTLRQHALSQGDLLNLLVSRGVKIKGKKPKNTLSAHVSYLVKKGVLVREGDLVALKQASLPGTTNENATKAH